MNLKEITSLLDRFQLRAKKGFGQNFLIDDQILEKIVKAIPSENRNQIVIEIGPGLGSLTRYLLNYYQQVISYEIDPNMKMILNETIDNPNLKVINQDFLTINLDDEYNTHFNQTTDLVANLPYYITTPILLKVLEEASWIKNLTIMIQKEVASRLLGKPKTKEYNALSVLLQYYTQVTKVTDVLPQSFYPAPKVESTVLRLTRYQDLPIQANDEPFFLKFNRAIFANRRKTLLNNLNSFKPIANQLTKEQIAKIITANHLITVRAEELAVNEIVKLSDQFSQLITPHIIP